MAVTAADEQRSEWRFLRGGFIAVVGLTAAWLIAWGIWELFDDEPTRLELTTRCITVEQGLPLESTAGDPIAESARGGTLATRVEGNGVHVSIAGSDDEAAELVRRYRAVAGRLEGRLEQRGRYVYLWEGVATSVGRQTMFDCEY